MLCVVLAPQQPTAVHIWSSDACKLVLNQFLTSHAVNLIMSMNSPHCSLTLSNFKLMYIETVRESQLPTFREVHFSRSECQSTTIRNDEKNLFNSLIQSANKIRFMFFVNFLCKLKRNWDYFLGTHSAKKRVQRAQSFVWLIVFRAREFVTVSSRCHDGGGSVIRTRMKLYWNPDSTHRICHMWSRPWNFNLKLLPPTNWCFCQPAQQPVYQYSIWPWKMFRSKLSGREELSSLWNSTHSLSLPDVW